MPERIYNPITVMGFSAMFTFQLDNTRHPIAVMEVVDTFGLDELEKVYMKPTAVGVLGLCV